MRGAGVLRKGCGAGETLRCAGGPRPGLCGHRLRWLESAVNHAGARCTRRGGRVLYAVEKLQHGGLAYRLYGR